MPQNKEHALEIKQAKDLHEGGVLSHATKVFYEKGEGKKKWKSFPHASTCTRNTIEVFVI
jgi:hypothetical protein